MGPADKLDLEFEYANPAMMQEYREHIPVWKREAAAYRDAARERSELEVAYGDKPRQRLDLFLPEAGRGGPVALFIHGGYFQARDKASFSHLARGPNAHGVTLALAGYTLCPQATIAEIIDELRQAVAFLGRRFARPVTVCGHSAGGHLAACLLATDWRAVDARLDERAVPAALPISGLFELEPLVQTSINAKLGLTAAEARRLSPMFWPLPPGRSVITYVGGNESAEYRRQARSYVARFVAARLPASLVEAAGASHFTVIAPLGDPDSALTRDLVRLAHAA